MAQTAENTRTLKSDFPVSTVVGTLNPEALAGLRRLGLNEYESKAYLGLATTGHATAGDLAETASLPRPRIYDVLRSLQEKGFVAVKQGRPVKFAASPIGDAVKTLKKQRESALAEELTRIEEIGGTLASRIKPVMPVEGTNTEDAVWTFRGREAIYSKIASMIANAKETVAISTTPSGAIHKFRANQKELTAAKARGVKIHVSTPTMPNELAKLAHAHYKKTLPTRFVLADDEALMFLTPEHAAPDEEVGVWLKSPHVTQTFHTALTAPAVPKK